MKLIALALALFSFSALASTLDCRETLNGSYSSYKIEFDGANPTSININGDSYSAHMDMNESWVTIYADSGYDVYEFSFDTTNFPALNRFSRINLTTYYSGSREILCRYKE